MIWVALIVGILIGLVAMSALAWLAYIGAWLMAIALCVGAVWVGIGLWTRNRP